MKKYVAEILITVLLLLLIGAMFLHSDRIDSVIRYAAYAVLFFAFIAAGERFAKFLGRGNYFAWISAACIFVLSAFVFIK